MRSFGFDGVVLVADVIPEEREGEAAGLSERRDLEQTEPSTFAALSAAISNLGLKLFHYSTPADLARNAERHLDDIVLSVFGGSSSRSRMALTPAVCEAFGLKYVGPDAYGRIVAQDKEISKRLAVDCGVSTPPWRVIRTEAELTISAGPSPPVVVKPLLEGSSIGISGRCLQNSRDGAVAVAADLLRQLQQPVLIEQFVPGREVSYVRIENSSADYWAFSEACIPDDPAYFDTRLLDAEEKVFRHPGRTVRNINSELAPEDKAALDALLAAFGRYGYCRVDGRLQAGRFHFIELTPDAWLGPVGQFAMGFTECGWTYEEVIAAVLQSAASTPRAPSSSG